MPIGSVSSNKNKLLLAPTDKRILCVCWWDFYIPIDYKMQPTTLRRKKVNVKIQEHKSKTDDLYTLRCQLTFNGVTTRFGLDTPDGMGGFRDKDIFEPLESFEDWKNRYKKWLEKIVLHEYNMDEDFSVSGFYKKVTKYRTLIKILTYHETKRLLEKALGDKLTYNDYNAFFHIYVGGGIRSVSYTNLENTMRSWINPLNQLQALRKDYSLDLKVLLPIEEYYDYMAMLLYGVHEYFEVKNKGINKYGPFRLTNGIFDCGEWLAGDTRAKFGKFITNLPSELHNSDNQMFFLKEYLKDDESINKRAIKVIDSKIRAFMNSPA